MKCGVPMTDREFVLVQSSQELVKNCGFLPHLMCKNPEILFQVLSSILKAMLDLVHNIPNSHKTT
jgi:hypothetical protein